MVEARKVDFNADIGEGYGVWANPNQIWRAQLERGGPIDSMDAPLQAERIMQLVSSVNLACGFHAGDPYLIRRYVAAAKIAGCRVGAHPSYPDKVGFGLRYMDIAKDELKAIIQYQIGALDGFLQIENMEMTHVKCHGALQNRAGHDDQVAIAIVEAVAEYRDGLVLFGFPYSAMEHAAGRVGVPFVREAFSDRAYHDNGALVDRRRPDSMVVDLADVTERVLRMVSQGVVQSIEGSDVQLDPATICFHADTPMAVDYILQCKDLLRTKGIDV